MMDNLYENARNISADFSLWTLRLSIIAWAIFIIVLVLCIKNKWALAGILAYEVLP